MDKIRFTDQHEWIRMGGDAGVVGISDYAQNALGDVVFVELPEKGAVLAKGDEAAVVESVKAASEIYAPVSGEITEVNEALADNTALVNQSPMENGWFFKIKLSKSEELETLMDEQAYQSFIEGLG